MKTKTLLELEGQVINIIGISGNSKDGCFLVLQNEIQVPVTFGMYYTNSHRTWLKSDKQAGYATRRVVKGRIEIS